MVEASGNTPEDLVSAVPVAILSTEWANGEDSGDEEQVEKHAVEKCSARDRRLTEGVDVLGTSPIIGDVDVEVIAETKDWAGAVDLDVEEGTEQIDKHMTEVYEAREERLRRVSEELGRQQMIGDKDVEVIVETKDWCGADDVDVDDAEENFEGHLSKLYEAREERLSRGSEELEKEQMIGDTDVVVIAEMKEWAGEEEVDIEEATDPNNFASEVFEERERRLTVAAEELDKNLVMGDTDVEVLHEAREWAGDEFDEEEEADNSDKHANEVFLEREGRLTAAAEELDKGLTIGDTDVEVITEGREWAQLGDDDEDDERENTEQHANDMFEMRERRLTSAAEELDKGLTIGDTDVEVIHEGKEWAGDDDDDEKDDTKHANDMFEMRERRLTSAAEELDKCLTIGDTDVEVIHEGKEWAGDDDDDEKDDTKHANDMFEMRERRLTVAADELDKGLTIGDTDVEVITESKEWTGLDDDDDDEKEVTEKHAADVFEMRERRLTVAAEELDKGLTLGDTEVEVINAGKEWGELGDDDDDEENGTEKHAEDMFEMRERRLTVSAEMLEANTDAKDEPSEAALCSDSNTDQAETSKTAPAVEEEEEESEWETEEETDDEIFKRANPDRGLRRRGDDAADPWRNMFKWIAGVVKHRRASDAVPKSLDSLLGPEALDYAALTPESLCDGKILCALIIALSPDALKKPIPNAMGRLGQVVKACKEFGVQNADLFGVPDILNSPPQNPNAVLRCLTSLSGVVATWEEYSGPKLRRSR